MAIFNISHSEDGKKLLSLKSPVDLSDIDTYECTSAPVLVRFQPLCLKQKLPKLHGKKQR